MAFLERTDCPMCGHAETTRLYACRYDAEPLASYLRHAYRSQAADCLELVAGVDFELDECEGCRGIFQRFAGDDQFQERLYADWIRAEENHAGQQSHVLKYYLMRANEIVSLIRHFEAQQPTGKRRNSRGMNPAELKVLDYGMGWGEWCQMARSFGCQTWGYDIAAPVLERARRQGLQVVSDLERPSAAYDVINAEQVFEHLVDPLATLQKLKGCLSPRGVIRICVPSARRIHQNLRRGAWTVDRHSRHSLSSVAPLEHLNCFAADSLAAMGRAAGLVPFQLADGLPIGFRGALKNALRPVLRRLPMHHKNVCYYRLPAADDASAQLRRAA
ncbi:MAG: class I SAM-dependent methyltransferase [Planctomycetaceae bacterium]